MPFNRRESTPGCNYRSGVKHDRRLSTLDYDFNDSGVVSSLETLSSSRRKNGQCITCGQQCFQKSVLRGLTPLTIKGKVSNGLCLKCDRPRIQQDRLLSVKNLTVMNDDTRSTCSTVISASTISCDFNSFEDKSLTRNAQPDSISDGGSRKYSRPANIGVATTSSNPNSNRDFHISSSVGEAESSSCLEQVTLNRKKPEKLRSRDVSTEEKNIYECMQVGGLDAIVQAMVANGDSPGIQEEGARLVSTMIESDGNMVESIGLQGGLFLMKRAMIKFPFNGDLQKMCFRALWMLSSNDSHLYWYIDNNLVERFHNLYERAFERIRDTGFRI